MEEETITVNKAFDFIINEFGNRMMLAAALGQSFEGERDLYTVLGYPKSLSFADYYAKYTRQDIAARIVETVHRHKKPVVVSVNVVSGADAVYNRFGQVMDSGGVPTYLTAERAMVCLNEFVRYRLVKERGRIGEWLR